MNSNLNNLAWGNWQSPSSCRSTNCPTTAELTHLYSEPRCLPVVPVCVSAWATLTTVGLGQRTGTGWFWWNRMEPKQITKRPASGNWKCTTALLGRQDPITSLLTLSEFADNTKTCPSQSQVSKIWSGKERPIRFEWKWKSWKKNTTFSQRELSRAACFKPVHIMKML